MNKLALAGLTVTSVFMLCGCKLLVVSDSGGSVTSSSGSYDCAAGQSCEYELPEGNFSQVFTATPAVDHKFAGWSGFCTEGSNPFSPSCTTFYDQVFTALDLTVELRANFNPAIVGTWLGGDIGNPDGFALVTYYEEGYFLTVVFVAPDDDTATNPSGGYSYGTWAWDPGIDAFNPFIEGNLEGSTWLQNSIGESGYLVSLATDGGASYYRSAAVSGDTIQFIIRSRFGGGDDQYDRVTNDSERGIEGTWSIGDITDFEGFVQLTFYGGYYVVAEYCDNGPEVGGGIQHGSYTWDEASGQLAVTVLRDTLDGCGLYDVAENRPNIQRAVLVAGGSKLQLLDGDTVVTATALR